MRPKFAVLGEDKSDAETLVQIVKRLLGDERASVFSKGFSGCGELCRKGASHIRQFAGRMATHFIICHDADGPDPRPAYEKVSQRVVRPSGQLHVSCIVVPVQEIEAWMMADEAAIAAVIPSLVLADATNPEQTANPKEWLIRQSRQGRSRPLYVPAVHNPNIARHLDLDKVSRKCPSFQPLAEFVKRDI